MVIMVVVVAVIVVMAVVMIVRHAASLDHKARRWHHSPLPPTQEGRGPAQRRRAIAASVASIFSTGTIWPASGMITSSAPAMVSFQAWA